MGAKIVSRSSSAMHTATSTSCGVRSRRMIVRPINCLVIRFQMIEERSSSRGGVKSPSPAESPTEKRPMICHVPRNYQCKAMQTGMPHATGTGFMFNSSTAWPGAPIYMCTYLQVYVMSDLYNRTHRYCLYTAVAFQSEDSLRILPLSQVFD